MKYHALFVIFVKVAKFCRLLQIIGGALRVKTRDEHINRDTNFLGNVPLHPNYVGHLEIYVSNGAKMQSWQNTEFFVLSKNLRINPFRRVHYHIQGVNHKPLDILPYLIIFSILEKKIYGYIFIIIHYVSVPTR